MTTTDDTTPTPQPDDTTTDETVEPDDDQQPDDTGEGQQPEPGNRAGREAAKRRAQLRAAEAERDGLRTRLAKYQAAEVTEVAAEVLAHGDDLLAVRGDLAQYLGEDGSVDPERVRAAAREVAEQRPHWAREEEPETYRPRGRGGPFSGAGRPKPVGSVDDSGKRVSWGDVVTPVGKKSAG